MFKELIVAKLLIAVNGVALLAQPLTTPNQRAAIIQPNYLEFYYRPVVPYRITTADEVDASVARVRRDLDRFRRGTSVDRIQTDIGETTLPYYFFFQFVLKTVKKMRRHYLPLYLTGPDLSSIYSKYK